MEIRLIIFITLAALSVITKLFWQRGYTVFKPLPVLFIIALAFLKTERVDSLWFGAIAFGLAGDILLLSEKGFIPGLISFLIGHIFYILAFSRDAAGFYFTPSLLLGVGAIVVGVSSYFTLHLLRSRRKRYVVPVIIYTVVSGLLIMGAFRYPLLSPAVIGAITFGFSDFLLAFNKFVRPIWYVQAGVSVTYYAAQWLLALHFRAL